MSWNQGGGNNGGPWGNGGNQNPWGNRGNGGRGNSDGPDLDAMLRQSQERLKSLFPGSGGPKATVLLIGLVLVLLVALQGLSQGHVLGFYRVNDGEVAVVQRFGAAVREAGPGLRWLLPIAEQYTAVSLSSINRIELGQANQGVTRRDEDGNQTQLMMLTGDANLVDMQFTVQWRVSDPYAPMDKRVVDARKFLFNMREPQTTLRVAAESVVREVIGQSQSQIMIATGSVRQTVRENVEKRLRDLMRVYDAGIYIDSVQLQRMEAPAPVTESFIKAQNAQQEANTKVNQADGYRNSIIPTARADANRMMEEARAYKAQTTATAQGDAERFTKVLQAYRQSETATSTRLYLETMESVLGGANKVILGGEGAERVMPYLPLDTLRRGAATSSTSN